MLASVVGGSVLHVVPPVAWSEARAPPCRRCYNRCYNPAAVTPENPLCRWPSTYPPPKRRNPREPLLCVFSGVLCWRGRRDSNPQLPARQICVGIGTRFDTRRRDGSKWNTGKGLSFRNSDLVGHRRTARGTGVGTIPGTTLDLVVTTNRRMQDDELRWGSVDGPGGAGPEGVDHQRRLLQDVARYMEPHLQERKERHNRHQQPRCTSDPDEPPNGVRHVAHAFPRVSAFAPPGLSIGVGSHSSSMPRAASPHVIRGGPRAANRARYRAGCR